MHEAAEKRKTQTLLTKLEGLRQPRLHGPESGIHLRYYLLPASTARTREAEMFFCVFFTSSHVRFIDFCYVAGVQD